MFYDFRATQGAGARGLSLPRTRPRRPNYGQIRRCPDTLAPRRCAPSSDLLGIGGFLDVGLFRGTRRRGALRLLLSSLALERRNHGEDREVRKRQDKAEVVVAKPDRRADDANIPEARGSGGSAHGAARPEDGAPAYKANASDQSWQYARLRRGALTEDSIARITKPQLAMATMGKVRSPALRAWLWRFHPIGRASRNASARCTRWQGNSAHRSRCPSRNSSLLIPSLQAAGACDHPLFGAGGSAWREDLDGGGKQGKPSRRARHDFAVGVDRAGWRI